MAREPDKKFFGTKELSERIEVSPTYLAKILQKLQHAGFLESITGPGGGFSLAPEARNKKLGDVVKTIESGELFSTCALGMSKCGNNNPCPFHERWAIFREEIQEYLETVSISDAGENFWPAFNK